MQPPRPIEAVEVLLAQARKDLANHYAPGVADYPATPAGADAYYEALRKFAIEHARREGRLEALHAALGAVREQLTPLPPPGVAE